MDEPNVRKFKKVWEDRNGRIALASIVASSMGIKSVNDLTFDNLYDKAEGFITGSDGFDEDEWDEDEGAWMDEDEGAWMDDEGDDGSWVDDGDDDSDWE